MKIPLKKTLAAFSVGLSALPVIVIGLLVLMMNSDIREIVNSEFDKIGARATRQIVEDTVRICKIIRRTQLDEDDKARDAVRERLWNIGFPKLLDKKAKIRVASQMTPTEFKTAEIPAMAFGNSEIVLKMSPDGSLERASGRAAEILEQLKTETGLDFAILQKIDADGNMLRIASTALDAEGTPFVGTYIPANGGYDDGAIVRTLLARKAFSGISRGGRSTSSQTTSQS